MAGCDPPDDGALIPTDGSRVRVGETGSRRGNGLLKLGLPDDIGRLDVDGLRTAVPGLPPDGRARLGGL